MAIMEVAISSSLMHPNVVQVSCSHHLAFPQVVFCRSTKMYIAADQAFL